MNATPSRQERVEAAVRELLLALGEDVERDGLRDTPRRVARMYAEVLDGNSNDPAEHLATAFEEDHDEFVLVKDIGFVSFCEHHMLPFIGKAHVGYVPGKERRIAGLSKLARVVDGYARRLQVQERLTTQVVTTIETELRPAGAIVVLEAEHLCMSIRGVSRPGTTTITSAVRGLFRDDHRARMEAMSLITEHR